MTGKMIKKKIIIDTDIGDDIDDALAIAFAMQSPEFDLLGITTVYKNTLLRAQLAKKLTSSYGMDDIPIYPGAGDPIISDINIDEIPCQCNADTICSNFRTEDSAISFLASTIKKHSGEITLVCIGPLTNAALLIKSYPHIAQKLKEIIIMGGSFYNHYSEWNIVGDPEAASIVFTSNIPLKAVGLDVTSACRISEDQFNRLLNSRGRMSGKGLLADLIYEWHKTNNWLPVLHDPLVLACLVNEDILKFKQEDIKIILDGYGRGMTYNTTGLRWDNNDIDFKSHVQVAYEIDIEQFMSLFFNRLL